MSKDKKIIEKTYDNGFEVIMIPKPGFVQKFAGIMIDYGSSDLVGDEVKYAGVAHFLEHKLFTKKDGEISTEFDEQNASVNAFTSYNETMYYASFIDHEQENISSLFKLVGNPYFTTENVAKEREIIVQELRMYQDDPMWKVNNSVMNLMYPGSILATDIAGTEETLAAINAESLLANWQKFYQAGNMKLVLAGDYDFSAILETISPEIAKLPVGNKIWDQAKLTQLFDANKVKTNTEVVNGKTAHQRFGVGIKLPNFKNYLDSNDSVQVLLEIMLESKLGAISDFYQRLHDDAVLQQELSFGVSYSRQGNYAKIFGQTDEPELVLEEVLKALKSTELSEKIFNLEKRELISKSFRTVDHLTSLAIECAESRLEDSYFFEDLERLQKIDFATFAKLVNQILADSQFVVVKLLPTEE